MRAIATPCPERLRELRMPIVTTLHTLLREPNANQRRVMQELIARSMRLVVMAERGRQMLQEIYQAPPAKIDLIPHGIPDIPFVDPNFYKDQFGVEGRLVLLTFGLLSPNTGIEHVLKALPEILAEFPQRRLHRAGCHSSQPGARARRGLPGQPGAAGQEEQGPPARHFLQMVWSNVARLYLRSFESARRERAVLSRKSFATKTLDQQPRALPELKLDHLSFDRRWLDEQGSEDSHGRSLWALGVGVGRSPYRSFQVMSGQVFAQALPAATDFTSPRAWAFALLGIHEYLQRLSGDRLAQQMRETLTTRLMGLFDRTTQPDWPWFEDVLSYDNAKLAHALILSGRAMGQTPVYERGLQALPWLAKVQTAESGDFRPIGSNGFFPRGGVRADFDQQPVEAHSMLSACLEAYRATSDAWWYEQAQRAFDWFLGWNDLGLELYSPNTGACRDALHVDRVNQNQGAESTLAFLLSLTELQLMQNAVTAFNRPAS